MEISATSIYSGKVQNYEVLPHSIERGLERFMRDMEVSLIEYCTDDVISIEMEMEAVAMNASSKYVNGRWMTIRKGRDVIFTGKLNVTLPCTRTLPMACFPDTWVVIAQRTGKTTEVCKWYAGLEQELMDESNLDRFIWEYYPSWDEANLSTFEIGKLI